MSFAPGWYYAQGDPEGTVRWWNGTEWIGFAQTDPQIPVARAVKPFEPILGQAPLLPFSVAAQLSLLGVIAVYAFRMYVTFRERNYRVAVTEGNLIGSDLERAELDNLISLQSWAWICAVFFLFCFGSIWFWRALANLRRWHRPPANRKLSHFVPLNLMLELQTHSPTKENEGELNPVLAWGWWSLFSAAGALERALERSSRGETDTASHLLAARMALIGGTIISFVLAIVLIEGITKHQDRRMKPSTAQVKQFEESQALEATLTRSLN